jgi:hypothetical protein
MPISYDVAFGGTDRFGDDEREHGAYLPNPVGRGWHRQLKDEWVDGTPLPNTEGIDGPVANPAGNYVPMSFGPLGRGWPDRVRFAGTYDQQWLDDVFPFLPRDFDARYYQAAPLDQQIPLPKSTLEVAMSGLTADGLRRFELPYFDAPVHVFPKRGGQEDLTASLDTIAFEPDHERFTMSWRVARPLKRNMHEIAQVLVGKKGGEWWQQREEIAFPIPVVMVPMDEEDAEA